MTVDYQLPVNGAMMITPEIHHDERGFFTTTSDTLACPPPPYSRFCTARSSCGVIRGLHVRPGTGEAKLVRCAAGQVFDVIVDLRQDSSTFLAVATFLLTGQEQQSLYIPPGVAHGYQAMSAIADVAYRIDGWYEEGCDLVVAWDDPMLSIDWPMVAGPMSQRDMHGMPAAEAAKLL